ncbi:efflux RND transporter periplasmic adaptor subunit [Roseovarius aestuariivivens]|uniref:efflux RND transporter periplasmic adaptor subunit n=1 Tax=Roseovarius aestuariivivens TaxID=1888910 RepID=UPI001081B481|nr:efflux RND transporter periplasmic adaptor subunit [Roseovarius aestuariivivens]
MTRTSFGKQLLICAILIGIGAAAWGMRAELGALWASVTGTTAGDARAERNRDGVPVITEPVRIVRDDLTFSAIGTGYAARSVTLRAPASGRITALSLSPDRTFAEDEVLLQLDDTDERLAVELAEAQLERATQERERYRALQDTGAAAQTRLEQVETDFKVARIELEQARADLEDRSLRAPFDGVTGIASVERGDRVAAEDAVATFDDRSSILVEFDLPEAFLSRVEPGLTVTARTPAVEGRSFDGRITAIDSRVDPATRTARIRASIDNSADILRPGASFSVRMDLPGAAYPAVPELAVQFSRGSLLVWRARDGTAEEVPVRLIRRRAGLVIVDGPLEEGEPVVVEGTQRLRPGVTLDVLNESTEASS